MAKKIISIVAVTVLLLSLVLLIVYFTRGAGKNTFDRLKNNLDGTFAVEYGGQLYKADGENKILLPREGEAIFRIRNASYVSVEVLPNADFEYSVDGETKSFADVGNILDVFLSEDSVSGSALTIRCTEGQYAVENVLREIYGSEAVIEVPKMTTSYFYKLVFTSEGSKIEFQFYQDPYVGVQALSFAKNYVF